VKNRGRGRRPPHFVVDASVARASGTPRSGANTSEKARSALERVRDDAGHIVWTHELRDEWRRHQSRFSSRWLKSMFSRRQICALSYPEEASVASAIYLAAARSPELPRMIKDVHLVDAALQADAYVISLDDASRRSFAALARSAAVVRLRAIVWTDPTRESFIEFAARNYDPAPLQRLGNY
jgi:hypothetical protein